MTKTSVPTKITSNESWQLRTKELKEVVQRLLETPEVIASTEKKEIQKVRLVMMDLQEECLQLPQIDLPIQEFWSDGTYGREIFIPAGTCLVGEIHATDWIIVVSRGKIQVVSEEGVKMYDATEKPITFISKAGAKRVGFALEDTWWTGFRYVGELKSTEEIKKVHLVKSFDEWEKRLCGE